MDTYEIIMTPDATADLYALRDYIADTLLMPDTALTYIRSIRKKIDTLEQMPERIAPLPEESGHNHGIRKLIANNFYIYYRIDKSSIRVYILNIIYSKRNQLKMLKSMNTD